ncbi:MAG: NAD-dependent epimerase/dehydratase family protein [Clostridiaceae bacterium]|nr:NAD-dependent epimerase/dehydratase family protein [Clostridiaceae bacterium]
MEVLVLGGTRFFGKHLVASLIKRGHHVTIATRGNKKDDFGNKVKRLIVDHTNYKSMVKQFMGKQYDVVYDDIAYCSNDIVRALESIKCERYILVSTTAVYDKHINTREEEFSVKGKTIVWGERKDFSYDEGKRQAESVLINKFTNQKSTMVRFPFVIGKDDYTERLLFYVEHTIKEIPMYIDNMDRELGYISSSDAGKFLAFLCDNEYLGAINGCSSGTISLNSIIDYVEEKTGKKAILVEDGEVAPYNGENEYSINTEKAKEIGFEFSNLRDWIYGLIDYYIEKVK